VHPPTNRPKQVLALPPPTHRPEHVLVVHDVKVQRPRTRRDVQQAARIPQVVLLRRAHRVGEPHQDLLGDVDRVHAALHDVAVRGVGVFRRQLGADKPVDARAVLNDIGPRLRPPEEARVLALEDLPQAGARLGPALGLGDAVLVGLGQEREA